MRKPEALPPGSFRSVRADTPGTVFPPVHPPRFGARQTRTASYQQDLPVGARQCHRQRQRPPPAQRRATLLPSGPSPASGKTPRSPWRRAGSSPSSSSPGRRRCAGGTSDAACSPSSLSPGGKGDSALILGKLPKKRGGGEGAGEGQKETDRHSSQRPALAEERRWGGSGARAGGLTAWSLSAVQTSGRACLSTSCTSKAWKPAAGRHRSHGTPQPDQLPAFPPAGPREREPRAPSDGKAAPKPTAHAQGPRVAPFFKAHTLPCRAAERPGRGLCTGRSPAERPQDWDAGEHAVQMQVFQNSSV